MSKQYFIAEGTNTIKEFDTLLEMLEFHEKMPTMSKHFCTLYDKNENRIANGNDVVFGIGWKPWPKARNLKLSNLTNEITQSKVLVMGIDYFDSIIDELADDRYETNIADKLSKYFNVSVTKWFAIEDNVYVIYDDKPNVTPLSIGDMLSMMKKSGKVTGSIELSKETFRTVSKDNLLSLMETLFTGGRWSLHPDFEYEITDVLKDTMVIEITGKGYFQE